MLLGAGAPFQGHQQHHDPGHGGDAGTLFVLEQHLGQKGPQGDRGRVDGIVVIGERDPFVVERRLDGFFGERRRQTAGPAAEETRPGSNEIVVATGVRVW